MPYGSSDEDQRLVEAARRGDSAAFETLYRRHRDYVLAVACRFGAGGQDALDVLQETFLYFFRALPRLNLNARFTTFLYPTVKHLALKRGSRTRRHVSLEEAAERVASVPSSATYAEGARAAADLVSTLPDLHREVLLLRFVDGLSLGEIAVALRIPVGTAKSRLHNALAALRRDLS